MLFLDEPTTGIDVASARKIRELTRNLNESGCTVFLTTHYLEEAERLCDRVAFIVKGRIVRIESVADLMQGFEERNTIQFTLNRAPADLAALLKDQFPDHECEKASGKSLKVYSDKVIHLAPFIRFLRSSRSRWSRPGE